MKKSENQTTRRDAIQQFAMLSAGMSMFPLTSFLTDINQENLNKEANVLTPFSIPPLEPLQPGPLGLDIRIWVRSSQTNMQCSSVEVAVAPKHMGAAPHLHKDLDELMLVLEGTASVLVDNKLYEIPAGGWQFRPRGIEHAFFNNTNKPLRFIDMYFNQNFEDYLEERFHKIIPDMIKNNLTYADPAIAKRINEIDLKFGITRFPEKRQPIIDKYGLIS